MSIAKRLFFDLPGFGRVHATDGSIKLAGYERAAEFSDLGPSGFSKEYKHGELKYKIKNQGGISLEAIHALENIDVTVTDDNGKTYVCSKAYSSEMPTLSGGEIDVSMMFETQQEVL